MKDSRVRYSMPGYSPIIDHISIYHRKPRKNSMYLVYQIPYIPINVWTIVEEWTGIGYLTVLVAIKVTEQVLL